MLIASENEILRAACASVAEAVTLVSDRLLACGLAVPGVAEAFRKNDQAFPCVLNGVAVLHLAAGEDTWVAKGGGVVALCLTQPLNWHGTLVRYVFALALPRAEQLPVWSRIAALSNDPVRMEALGEAETVSDLLSLLNADMSPAPAAPILAPALAAYEVQIEVELKDVNGLHARPAARLAALAAGYPGKLVLGYAGKWADLNSVGALMGLGIGCASTVTVAADGDGAHAIAQRVVAAIAAGLDVDAAEDAPVVTPDFTIDLPESAQILRGIAASPGIGIAPLFVLAQHDVDAAAAMVEFGSGCEVEERALQNAWRNAEEDLRAEVDTCKRNGDKVSAGILEAHLALLMDDSLRQPALQEIAAGKSAPYAWRAACRAKGEEMRRSGSARIAERATDYEDLALRLLRYLLPETFAAAPVWPEHAFIVAAEDLTPSQTSQLPLAQVAGIVTAQGGPTAHTAILARAFGIPAVVALGKDAWMQLTRNSGDTSVILNGFSGTIEPNPEPEQLRLAREIYLRLQARQRELELHSAAAAATTDGRNVEIGANISRSTEVELAVQKGADGVGLLRTELLVQDFKEAPTEELLIREFAAIAPGLAGRPILVRTYDIGGDKPVAFMPQEHENNPFLGVRGIRLCLKYPEIFDVQLRAIVRAVGECGLNAKILLPMITSLDELLRAKAWVRRIAEELHLPMPPVGIMIEVPAVIWQMDRFAAESDFFSIGTNDLTQYILAMDRQHPVLAAQADTLSPAVLRAIAHAIAEAHKAGKWIGVCGNLATDPIGAKVLLGLGIDELSVGAGEIPRLKELVRSAHSAELARLAQAALACDSASTVRALFA